MCQCVWACYVGVYGTYNYVHMCVSSRMYWYVYIHVLPHQVSLRSQALHDRAAINCQFSMAPFSTSERHKRSKGDRRSEEISLALRQTFEAALLTELFPQSKIDVYIQLLQSDGGEFIDHVEGFEFQISYYRP